MKVEIVGSLNVQIQPDGFTAMILTPITYKLGRKSIVVEADWITDWASVPQRYWRWFPPMGTHTFASVLHDYLYKFKIGSRRRADWYFLAVMKHSGVRWWRRWAMYLAVRFFGKSAWET